MKEGSGPEPVVLSCRAFPAKIERLRKEDMPMMQRHRLAIPAVDQFPASGTTIKGVAIGRLLRSLRRILFSWGSFDRRFWTRLHIVRQED
jgi:hypothetical protein